MLRIFEDVKREVSGGACASYIPALASADPSLFAVSICTVDGQQFSCGDAAATFSFQSCVKPLIYAVAVEDRGLSLVHRHVGFEPSGLAFNEVSLNPAGLPHNPMVNAGAISTGALVGPGCVRSVAVPGRLCCSLPRVDVGPPLLQPRQRGQVPLLPEAAAGHGGRAQGFLLAGDVPGRGARCCCCGGFSLVSPHPPPLRSTRRLGATTRSSPT